MAQQLADQPLADVGPRDARGDWRPPGVIETPPLFVWPPRPGGFLRWLFGWGGYLWPWNTAFALVSIATWLWLTPAMDTMRTLEAGWIAWIAVRNVALMVLLFGGMHLWLYGRRAQGLKYKYTNKWLNRESKLFLFNDQVRDNVFWSVVSGGTVWTTYEVLTLWAFANGWLPYVDPRENPVWFMAVFLLIPLFRELHFYCVHRLIHFKPLYKTIHYLHHKNTNVGPWSGLAMHPVEHVLYFSGVLIHWIVPSHPFHAVFHLQHLAFAPAPGHAGFDEIVTPGDAKVPNHNYIHYLHHKYFTVNYGGDGSIPLDRWFGTLHDGSPEADAAMRARTRKI